MYTLCLTNADMRYSHKLDSKIPTRFQDHDSINAKIMIYRFNFINKL